jgi:2-keto-4-pentenoate hydratase
LNREAANIAEQFLSARRAAAGLAAYPGDMPHSLPDAYAVQDAAIAKWNHPIIGWKVGRVPAGLTTQFGTDRLAGPIFSSRYASDGEEVEMPVFAQGFAAGEAEFLLKIGRTPPPAQTAFTLDEAAELIEAVHVGIEIASSPLQAINELGPIAVVSDFGNNNGMVIGPAIPDWRSHGFEQWLVETTVDGQTAGTGQAANFPHGAIGSARFLFELMAKRQIPLARGQWISSGAVTGVHQAAPGQLVEAVFDDRLKVRCRLAAARPEYDRRARDGDSA